jgi:hypothetical protein
MSGVWLVLFAALWLVVVCVVVILVGVLKQLTRLLDGGPTAANDFLLRSSQVSATYGGVPPGTKLADFTVFDREGREVSSSWLHGEPRLYLFVSSGCSPCDQLLDQIRGSEVLPAALGSLTLIVHDFDDEKLRGLKGIQIYRQREHSVSQAFASRSFPQAFLVDEDGIVLATTIPASVEEIAGMYEQLIGGDLRNQLSAVRNGRNELTMEVPTR